MTCWLTEEIREGHLAKHGAVTLAKRLAEVKAEENGEKLMGVTTDSLVEALANTLAEVEAETVGERLGDGRPRHWLPRLLTR